MDGTDGRLSLAVMSACAALVLFAGGAWWVVADPGRRAEPAQATPTTPAAEATELVEQDLDSYLPAFPNTIERQVGPLDADTTRVMPVPSEKGHEYRLQYVCLGPGDLSVLIKGTTEGEMLYNVDCEGNLSTFQFVAADSNVVVIEVHRPGPEGAAVGVQVIDVQ